MTFGPGRFASIPRYGVGLGLNPSDFHDSFLADDAGVIDYFEITAPSTRHQGPASYREIQRRRAQPEGRRHLRIPDLAKSHRTLVHSTDLNPVYPDPASPEDLASLRELVELSGSPWVTEDLGVWLMSERHVYPYFMPFAVDEHALAVTIANVHRIHEALGVPFNAEFPPMSMLAGDMHAFDFFAELVESTGAGMCLDVGHVLSYQIARGASPTSDFHRLPWEHVTEVHLAGGGIDLHDHGYRYDDSHGDAAVVSVCFDLVDEVIGHAPNLRAITLEIFGATVPELVVGKLRDLRARPAVSAWLTGSEQPSRPRIEIDRAREMTRRSLVGVYDALHGGSELTAETIAALGEPFLGAYAPTERRRWEYERLQRLRLHGLNVVNYFPLTARWLMRRDRLDELNFFERLVPLLDGADVPMREKVATAFSALVAAQDDDVVGRELLRAEGWMNDCACAPDTLCTERFEVHVPRLIKALRSATSPVDSAMTEPVTLRHTGECRFETVPEPEAPALPEAIPRAAEPTVCALGRAACCTGE